MNMPLESFGPRVAALINPTNPRRSFVQDTLHFTVSCRANPRAKAAMEALAVQTTATSKLQAAARSSTLSTSASASSSIELRPGFLGTRLASGFRAQQFERSRRRIRSIHGAESTLFSSLEVPSAGFGRVAPPRLQDLNPDTMLLQQRIIFLGGQVCDSARFFIGPMPVKIIPIFWTIFKILDCFEAFYVLFHYPIFLLPHKS
jgi:hypothetical protein